MHLYLSVCFVVIWNAYVTVLAKKHHADNSMDFRKKDHSNWVDPSDMFNYDHSKKEMKQPKKSLIADDEGNDAKDTNCPLCQCPYIDKHKDDTSADLSKCEDTNVLFANDLQKCQDLLSERPPSETAYFQQLVNVILKYLNMPVIPLGEEVYYKLLVKLNGHDFDLLEKFGRNGGDNVQSAHAILANMIINAERSHGYYEKTWNDKLADLWNGYDNIIILSFSAVCFVSSIGVIVLSQWKNTVSLRKLFLVLFIVLFFLSVPWTWWRLYQEKLSDRMLEVNRSPPIGCLDRELTWWQSIRSTLTVGEDECQQYHRAIFVDPIFDVPPTQAFVVTLTRMVLEPLHHLGSAFGQLLSGLMVELPFYMWFVAIPVLCGFLILLILVMAGYKFNFAHIIGIEPGRPMMIAGDDQPHLQALRVRVQDLEQELNTAKHQPQHSLEGVTNQPHYSLALEGALHYVQKPANSDEGIRKRCEVNDKDNNCHTMMKVPIDDVGTQLKVKPLMPNTLPLSNRDNSCGDQIDYSPKQCTSMSVNSPCDSSITPCSESSSECLTSHSEITPFSVPQTEVNTSPPKSHRSSLDITPCSDSSDDDVAFPVHPDDPLLASNDTMVASTDSFVEVLSPMDEPDNTVLGKVEEFSENRVRSQSESSSDIEIIEPESIDPIVNLSLD